MYTYVIICYNTYINNNIYIYIISLCLVPLQSLFVDTQKAEHFIEKKSSKKFKSGSQK